MVSAPWQRDCYPGLLTLSFSEPLPGTYAASLVDRRSASLSAQAQLRRGSWHTTVRGIQHTSWHQTRHHEIRTFFDLLMCTRPSGSQAISGRSASQRLVEAHFVNLNSCIGIALDDVASLPTCFVIFGATLRHSTRKKRLDIDQSLDRYKPALASTGCIPK